MKTKQVGNMNKSLIKNMHWTAKLTIKFGTLLSLLVLLLGFFPEQGSYMAISFGETAVYMFALSMNGGLLLDVIAQRMGLRE